MPTKSRSYQVSATLVTVLTHLLAIAITTLVLVWLLHFRNGVALNSFFKVKILNVHTISMVIGFILISGEAIIVYKTIPAERKVQKTVHVALQLIALTAVVVGAYAAFKFKYETNAQDMSTLHSWLGMITICLFGLQWLLGFFSFVFPGAESSSRASYMPWHVFGGMFIFLLAICTAVSGFLQRSNALGLGTTQEGLIVNFTGLLLVLFAVGVGLSVVISRGY